MQYIKGYEGAMQNKSSAFKTHEQIGAKHAPLNLNHKTPNPTLKIIIKKKPRFMRNVKNVRKREGICIKYLGFRPK
jgi:hypothetical protein